MIFKASRLYFILKLNKLIVEDHLSYKTYKNTLSNNKTLSDLNDLIMKERIL